MGPRDISHFKPICCRLGSKKFNKRQYNHLHDIDVDFAAGLQTALYIQSKCYKSLIHLVIHISELANGNVAL